MNSFNNGHKKQQSFEYPRCPKCVGLDFDKFVEVLLSNASNELCGNGRGRDYHLFGQDLIQDVLLIGLEKIRKGELEFLLQIKCLCCLSNKDTVSAFCRWGKSVIRRQKALYFRKQFAFRKLVDRVGQHLSEAESPMAINPSDEEILHSLVVDQMKRSLTQIEWEIVSQLPQYTVAKIAELVGRSKSTVRRIRSKAKKLFEEALEKCF